jgi:heme/copper-type cytochrome/quinol oxidase subunit 4
MSDVESTLDDPALLPGTPAEREAEAEHGLSAIRSDELPMLPGEVKPHSSPFQYVMIAVVLCILTAVEVGLYYLEGDIPTALLVGCLLALALVKFIMVASLYMHLSSDKPIFKRFFITGAIGAVLLYTIVLTTLHIWD